jgi:FixJ family two-component response regulator
MPEMSGLDLVEALDRTAFDSPVLLMSGYADHPEVERAQRAGLKILPKPVDLGHLAREIRRAIDAGSEPGGAVRAVRGFGVSSRDGGP